MSPSPPRHADKSLTAPQTFHGRHTRGPLRIPKATSNLRRVSLRQGCCAWLKKREAILGLLELTFKLEPIAIGVKQTYAESICMTRSLNIRSAPSNGGSKCPGLCDLRNAICRACLSQRFVTA
jgi:hypothetical protein